MNLFTNQCMSLYLCETKDEVEPPPDSFRHSDVLTFYVDKMDLTGNQNVLGRHLTEDAQTLVCGRFTEPVIKALSVVMHLANTPQTCQHPAEKKATVKEHRPKKPKKKTKGGGKRKKKDSKKGKLEDGEAAEEEEEEESESDGGDEDFETAVKELLDAAMPDATPVTVNQTRVFVADGEEGEPRVLHRAELFQESIYTEDERESRQYAEWMAYKDWLSKDFIEYPHHMEEEREERRETAEMEFIEKQQKKHAEYVEWLEKDKKTHDEAGRLERCMAEEKTRGKAFVKQPARKFRADPPPKPEDEYRKYLEWLVADNKEHGPEGREERLRNANLQREEEFRTCAPSMGVRGWRFWFFMYDKLLDWDVGIARLCGENAAVRKPSEPWHWVRHPDEWVERAVSPCAEYKFSGEKKANESTDSRQAYYTALWSEHNPARCSRVFNFARSQKTIERGGSASAAQLCMDGYLRADGSLGRFPRGARYVPTSMREPSHLLGCQLEKPAYVRSLPSTSEERWLQMTRTIKKFTGDAYDEMNRLVKNSFETDVANDPEKRRAPEMIDRFTSWVYGEFAPPGIAAAAAHLRTKIGTSIVPEETTVWDKDISEFANMIVGYMMMNDQVFKTSHWHPELLMHMINSLGAFRNELTLRIHPLQLGPAASGKSWLHETLRKMLIPGTFQEVSYQSKRANNTNAINDCLVEFSDEAPEVVTDSGTDGQGNVEMKQKMTSGRVYTKRCRMDEDSKEAVTDEIVGRELTQISMNYNGSMRTIAKPLVTRFMPLWIPLLNLPEKEDTALSGMLANNDEVLLAVVDRLQTTFAIVAMLTHGSDMRWLMQPDLDFAHTLLERFFQKLKGVRPEPRHRERMPLYIRPTMFLYAAHMVFNTTKHFAPGTKFEMRHLLECERYFRATREIVYFCVSHLSFSFVDPYAYAVYEAIKKINKRQPGPKHPQTEMRLLWARESSNQADEVVDEEERETLQKGKDSDTKRDDLRRLLLIVPLVGQDKSAITNAVVDIVTNEIGMSQNVVYSKEMVYDVIRWMDTQGQDSHGIPVVSVHTQGKMTEYGLAFSVDFLGKDARHIVREAIEETLDEHVKPGTKFLLGTTYRDGIPDGEVPQVQGTERKRRYPHLLQVMEVSDKQRGSLVVRNHAYRPPEFSAFLPKRMRLESSHKPFVELNVDYEAKREREHLAQLKMEAIKAHTEVSPEGRRDVQEGMGAYPAYFMQTYAQRFNQNNFERVEEKKEVTEKLAFQ
jgi:hypothetical protein